MTIKQFLKNLDVTFIFFELRWDKYFLLLHNE